MSFRFTNPGKIEALRQAGFNGFPHRWIHALACPCCTEPEVGWIFPEPEGVTTSQHDKAISLALWAAGYK